MENTAKKDEISLLQEILKWIKFAGMNQVKAVLEKELEEDADKIIYQNSDGSKGTVELGTLGGMGKDAVHDRWESWAKMGLGENIPVRGGTRFKRSFDLEELGIKVPQKKETQKAEQKPVLEKELEVSK